MLLKDFVHDCSIELDRTSARAMLVFLELRSRKLNCSLLGTDNVADKYPSIFSRQMEAIVYPSFEFFVRCSAVM